MSRKKRFAVIGAGPSGLSAIKACKEENLDITCFEKSDSVGGAWVYREESVEGMPSMMRSTVSNTSKEMSAFSDFPFPNHFPNYMRHHYILKYFQLYAQKFELISHIKFHHEVVKAVQNDDYDITGRWLVTIRDIKGDRETEEVYDGIMVCTGQTSYPNYADYDGLNTFKGKVMHSHYYKTPNEFEGKNVLIIGFGNSGVDIAVELSSVAKKVFITARRGSWLLSRVGPEGFPNDLMGIRRSNSLVPAGRAIRQYEKMKLKEFNLQNYYLKPSHRISSQLQIVNEDLPSRLLNGTIHVRRDVVRVTENGVYFVGECRQNPIDVIIMATGYSLTFPFLQKDIIEMTDHSIRLYKNVLPPKFNHPSLAFIGLIQPTGPLFPVFEMQTRWVARMFGEKLHTPDQKAMIADIEIMDRYRYRNYVRSYRHAMKVSYMTYMDEIANLIGVKPPLFKLMFKDFELYRKVFYGPFLPYQFRLCGPHAWDGAREAIMKCNSRVLAPMQRETSRDCSENNQI